MRSPSELASAWLKVDRPTNSSSSSLSWPPTRSERSRRMRMSMAESSCSASRPADGSSSGVVSLGMVGRAGGGGAELVQDARRRRRGRGCAGRVGARAARRAPFASDQRGRRAGGVATSTRCSTRKEEQWGGGGCGRGEGEGVPARRGRGISLWAGPVVLAQAQARSSHRRLFPLVQRHRAARGKVS